MESISDVSLKKSDFRKQKSLKSIEFPFFLLVLLVSLSMFGPFPIPFCHKLETVFHNPQCSVLMELPCSAVSSKGWCNVILLVSALSGGASVSTLCDATAMQAGYCLYWCSSYVHSTTATSYAFRPIKCLLSSYIHNSFLPSILSSFLH